MKYTYILGFLILGHELSIAVNNVDMPLLVNHNESLSPKKRLVKDYKSSLSTPITKRDFSRLNITQIPEKLEQKAAIDFLDRLSKDDQLNMLFNKAATKESTKAKIRRYAKALDLYLSNNKETASIENKIVQQFITEIGHILKKCPSTAAIFFNKPSSNTIIGLPYLCSKYLKNSELFLLFTSAILETSALEIACAMKDTEYMSPMEFNSNNIEYRRWAINVNIRNIVDHLRKYAQKIFDVYTDTQKSACIELYKNLFDGTDTNEYVDSSAKQVDEYITTLEKVKKEYAQNKKLLPLKTSNVRTVYVAKLKQQIAALQDYMISEQHKLDIEQSISMMKTFYVDAVKKFYINRDQEDSRILELRDKLPQKHGTLMIEKFFINDNPRITDEQIKQKSLNLYYSLLGDYGLENFIAFFNIIDSANYYQRHSFDKINRDFSKKCDNKHIADLLNIIDKSQKTDIVKDNLEKLIKSYNTLAKQIEVVKRLLKNNLTTKGSIGETIDDSINTRLKAIRMSLIANAYTHIYLYNNKQEISKLADYVIMRILEIINETSNDINDAGKIETQSIDNIDN